MSDDINRKMRVLGDLGFCIGLLEGLGANTDKNTREWYSVIIEKLTDVRKEMEQLYSKPHIVIDYEETGAEGKSLRELSEL